jgi:2-dehydropantoate 2-reductase
LRIRIVGAGALGLLFTSQLRKTSAEVELITHSSKQSELLTANGLLSIDHNKETRVTLKTYSIGSTNYINETTKPVDWLFLMVKQKDITDLLLNQLTDLATERTRIVCFQNGIGHIELLMKVFSEKQLYAAITTEGAIKLSDCSVKHAGNGITWLGRVENEPNERTEWDLAEKMLHSVLIEAGFEIYLSKKITSRIWNKLLINAVINPLTAIFQMRNGSLLESTHAQELMKSLMEEGRMVAQLAQIEIAEDLWEQLLIVCEKTAENHSSMKQDIANGALTEIDWINGALIWCADQYNLTLPTHQTVYRMIKHLESR